MEEYRPKLRFRDIRAENVNVVKAAKRVSRYASGSGSFRDLVSEPARRMMNSGASGRAFQVARRMGSHLKSAYSGYRMSPTLDALHQRVIVKTRIVKAGGSVSGKVRAHMSYITRDGAGEDEKAAELFGSDEQSKNDFVKKLEGDDRHFRLIISPENVPPDMESYTRAIMTDMEKKLHTRLEWKAVIHENTEHPHAHVMLRGVDENGKNLHIPNDYLTQGIRRFGREQLTRILGYRTELDRERALDAEVEKTRVTSLDHQIDNRVDELGLFDFTELPRDGKNRARLINRANRLVEMGAASQSGAQSIRLETDWKDIIRTYGHRRDMASRVYKAFPGEVREIVDLKNAEGPRKTALGEVRLRGLADELYDRPYVVIDGADGRIYHTTFRNLDVAADLKEGAVVRIVPGQAASAHKRARPPSVAVVSSANIEKSVAQTGPNWLDEYARSGSGAGETILQKRLQKAVQRRQAFHAKNGRPDLLHDDDAYRKWLIEERGNSVPPAIRKGGRDVTGDLLFGRNRQSFDGVMTDIIDTAQGPLGIVQNPLSRNYATVTLSANQRALKGQPVLLRSMNQQHQNRILVQMLTRSR